MTNLDRRVLLGIAGIAGAAIATQATRAGSLNPPPGPVTPTGKTTDQLEPRVDLLNAPASANVTSDAGNHYIINQSGSYYLSADIIVSKSVGISVQASGVTLDLSGLRISGVPSSKGVVVADGLDSVSVGNGIFSTLFAGVSAPHAIACTFARLTFVACDYGLLMDSAVADHCAARSCRYAIVGNSRCAIADCLVEDNMVIGIDVGDDSVVTRCTVQGDSGSYAIDAGDNCTLTDCVASSNGTAATPIQAAIRVFTNCILTRCSASRNHAAYGISLGRQSIAVDCVANENIGAATSSGFMLAAGAIARGCTSSANSSTAATQNAETGAGFFVQGNDCAVEDCMAAGNTGAGICAGSAANATAANQVRIHRCETHENASDGVLVYANDVTVSQCRSIKNSGSGVHVQTGSSNVIENNQTLGNTGYGIGIDSAITLVFGNQARGNSLGNYSIVAGNRVGTIVVPATNATISGNSGGSAFTTDPYANIAF